MTTRVVFFAAAVAAALLFGLPGLVAVAFFVSAAAAFFLAATLAVVEPFDGIAIGPFLDPGLEGLESQGFLFGDFFIPLKILAMSS